MLNPVFCWVCFALFRWVCFVGFVSLFRFAVSFRCFVLLITASHSAVMIIADIRIYSKARFKRCISHVPNTIHELSA